MAPWARKVRKAQMARRVRLVRLAPRVREQATAVQDAVAALSQHAGEAFAGVRVLLYTDDADAVADKVAAAGIEPESVVSRRSTLEDVFLRLTGRTLVD